jgi:hypothetical protein
MELSGQLQAQAASFFYLYRFGIFGLFHLNQFWTPIKTFYRDQPTAARSVPSQDTTRQNGTKVEPVP